MSLGTDIIFVKALRSNPDLMAKLAAHDVYDTSIEVPDEEFLNVAIPYIIITFDGLTNQDGTKDDEFEGDTDTVNIGIEITAKTKQEVIDPTSQCISPIENADIIAIRQIKLKKEAVILQGIAGGRVHFTQCLCQLMTESHAFVRQVVK